MPGRNLDHDVIVFLNSEARSSNLAVVSLFRSVRTCHRCVPDLGHVACIYNVVFLMSWTVITMYICGTHLELWTHLGRTLNFGHGLDFYNGNLPPASDDPPGRLSVVSRVGSILSFACFDNKYHSKLTTATISNTVNVCYKWLRMFGLFFSVFLDK